MYRGWCVLILSLFVATVGVAEEEKRWYKGNTHTHTLWSDGDAAPELVVDSFAGFLIAAAWIPYDLPLVAAAFGLFVVLHLALKWGIGLGRTRLVNAPVLVGAAVIAGLAAGAIASRLTPWLG